MGTSIDAIDKDNPGYRIKEFLGLETPSSSIYAYVNGEAIRHFTSTTRTLTAGQRLVYRAVGLSEDNCPGLHDEIKKMSDFRATSGQTSTIRHVGEAAVSPVKIEPHPTPGLSIFSHTPSRPLEPFPLERSDSDTERRSSKRQKTRKRTTKHSKGKRKALAVFPRDFHVCEIKEGFQKMKDIMTPSFRNKYDNYSDEARLVAFHKSFGDEVKCGRASFFDKKKYFLDAPIDIVNKFVSFGSSRKGLWNRFVEAVEKHLADVDSSQHSTGPSDNNNNADNDNADDSTSSSSDTDEVEEQHTPSVQAQQTLPSPLVLATQDVFDANEPSADFVRSSMPDNREEISTL